MDQHKNAAQHSTEPIGGSAHSTDCSIHRRVSSCCMTQSHKPSRSMPRCVRGPRLVATDHTLTPQQLKNRSGSRTKGTVTSNVLWPSPVLSCRPHQPSIECAHATCLGPLHLGCRSALQAQEAATRTAQYDKPLLMCCGAWASLPLQAPPCIECVHVNMQPDLVQLTTSLQQGDPGITGPEGRQEGRDNRRRGWQ